MAECYTMLKQDKDAIAILDGIPSRQRTPKVSRINNLVTYFSLPQSFQLSSSVFSGTTSEHFTNLVSDSHFVPLFSLFRERSDFLIRP